MKGPDFRRQPTSGTIAWKHRFSREGAWLRASYQQMKAVRLPSSDAVRAAIVASLRHGDATLNGTARACKISTRTLQRHLGRMGTSHSAMLAEVRLNIACRMLVDSSKPLSDIASFLGYANASSFSRIFVRLMKIQPIVYRQQQLAGKRERASKHARAIDG